ncbi:MAG: neuraminidase-like domain-containing protein, partial [Isosphaeraceae bacterium]
MCSCGYFHDLEDGEDVLRVLARTQGSPPTYYTRTWVDSSKWTAWEQVQLDIASDHVLPLVWNGRQYIFWAVVTVKADQSGQPIPAAVTSSKPPPGPNMHLEVQLAWSQYKQGKWQAKQTAPQTLVFQGPWDSTDFTLKSSFNGEQLEIDVFLDTLASWDGVHVGAYQLGGAGSGVEAFLSQEFFSGLTDVGGASVTAVGLLDPSVLKPDIGSPTSTLFDGDWLKPASPGFVSASRPRVAPMWVTYQEYQSLNPEQVLGQADYFRLVTPHQTPTFDSTLPFFYRDSRREYFIVPTNYYQNGNYFTINAPEYVYDPFYKAEYTFWTFYHPWAGLLVSQLNSSAGIDALYDQQVQLNPASVAGVTPFDFQSYYEPTGYVLTPYPQEDMDFGSPPSSSSSSSYSIFNAPYAIYNWEMFFHAPFLIANSLSNNQQFQLAKQWY